MEKIKVLLEKENISFSYYKHPLSEKKQDLMNTNVISRNELTFSEEYILNNAKMVTIFLRELAASKNINTVKIEDYSLCPIVLNLINELPFINTMIITDKSSLTYDIEKLIIDNGNITYLEMESAPTYLIEELDKYGIRIETNNEILYLSNFMNQNGLNKYTKIYYRVAINITSPLTSVDESEFETFCQINQHLKTIHFNVFNNTDLDFVINTLHRNHKKYIDIMIHENIYDEKTIKTLKKLNKKYRHFKIFLHLAYNEEYLKNNVFKQIIVNILKVCGIMSALIVFLVFGYIFYNNYQSMQNVLEITANIEDVITDNPDLFEEDIKNNTNRKVNALIALNKDTVGWLTINDTNVNYPILQGNDNDFYLNHNFNKDKDYNGWVFLDYRNVKDSFDQNNIIYGHNRYYSGVMFGTIKKIFSDDYFDNSDNLMIKYNTLSGNYEWEIFSIYKIKTTTDYLTTNFDSDEEYQDFINMISNRSQKEFDANVTTNDKILTLSTCADNENRLVVHAVLKK